MNFLILLILIHSSKKYDYNKVSFLTNWNSVGKVSSQLINKLYILNFSKVFFSQKSTICKI